MHGKGDVLVRCDDHPSDLGDFPYRVEEVKRSEKIDRSKNPDDYRVVQGYVYHHMLPRLEGYSPPVFTLVLRDHREEIPVEGLERTLDGVPARWRAIRDGRERPPHPVFDEVGSPWRVYGNKVPEEDDDAPLLPGVTPSVRKKLGEKLGLTARAEVERLSLEDLKKTVGPKTGAVLHAKIPARRTGCPVVEPGARIDLLRRRRHLYFDFETCDNLHPEVPPHVYRIGLYDWERERYEVFTAESPQDEARIFREFLRYVGDPAEVCLYHWADHENKTVKCNVIPRLPEMSEDLRRRTGSFVDPKAGIAGKVRFPTRTYPSRSWLRCSDSGGTRTTSTPSSRWSSPGSRSRTGTAAGSTGYHSIQQGRLRRDGGDGPVASGSGPRGHAGEVTMARGRQVGRQWRLLRALAGHGAGRTADELAGDFECHPRTVRRDLKTLEEAGFPIERRRDRRTNEVRYRFADGYQLPGVCPTDAEMKALYFASNLASSLGGSAVREGMESLLRKLEATLPEGRLHALTEAQNALLAKRGPRKDYADRAALIERIQEAVAARRKLEIRYRGYGRADAHTHVFHPYALTWWDGTLYLVGRSELRGAIRKFVVERIENLGECRDTFTIPEDFEVEDYLEESFGMYHEGTMRDVRIEFDPAMRQFLREREWHPSQQIEETTDGRLVLRLRVAGLEDILRWVLRFGREARVLEPEELRRLVVEEHRAALERYEREKPPGAPHS